MQNEKGEKTKGGTGRGLLNHVNEIIRNLDKGRLEEIEESIAKRKSVREEENTDLILPLEAMTPRSSRIPKKWPNSTE